MHPLPHFFTADFFDAWGTWCDNHSAAETVDLMVKHEMWVTARGDNKVNHDNKRALFNTVVAYASSKKPSR